MGLDDAGIDRILKNVGDVPGILDKSELREDILAAWDFYQGYKRADSKGARTERRDHAIKIAHKTNELIRLLNDPAGDWVRSRIGRLLSLRERNEDEEIVSLASLTRSLDELLSVVRTIERQCTGTASFREVLNARPSFWLIGNDLVKVFEKHFAKQAARTRNSDGQPDSPFVRFVTAVTAELGEPVVDETVSKAMSAVAKVKTTPPVVTSPVAQAPPPPPPTGATDAATEQDQGRVLFDTPIGPADERGAILQPGQEAPGEIGPPTGAKVKTDD